MLINPHMLISGLLATGLALGDWLVIPAHALEVEALRPARARAIVPLRIVFDAAARPQYVRLGVKKQGANGSLTVVVSDYQGRRIRWSYLGRGVKGRWQLEIPLVADYEEIGLGRFLFREAGTYQLEWSFRVDVRRARKEEAQGRSLVQGRSIWPVGATSRPSEEVALVRHTIDVAAPSRSDVEFIRSLDSRSIRDALGLQSNMPDRQEVTDFVSLVTIDAMLAAATRLQNPPALPNVVQDALEEVIAKHPDSSYAPYGAHLLATLDCVQLTKKLKGPGMDVALMKRDPVYGRAQRTAETALKRADVLLRPKALMNMGLLKALAREFDAADAIGEQLRNDYAAEPMAEKILWRFERTLGAAKRRAAQPPTSGSTVAPKGNNP